MTRFLILPASPSTPALTKARSSSLPAALCVAAYGAHSVLVSRRDVLYLLPAAAGGVLAPPPHDAGQSNRIEMVPVAAE